MARSRRTPHQQQQMPRSGLYYFLRDAAAKERGPRTRAAVARRQEQAEAARRLRARLRETRDAVRAYERDLRASNHALATLFSMRANTFDTVAAQLERGLQQDP